MLKPFLCNILNHLVCGKKEEVKSTAAEYVWCLAIALWEMAPKRPWNIGSSQDVWYWTFSLNGPLCMAAILGE